MRRKSRITKRHFPKVLEAFQKVLLGNTGFPVGLISLKVFIDLRTGSIQTPSKHSAAGYLVKASHMASYSHDTLWLTLLTPFCRQQSETQSHRETCTRPTMVSRFKPRLPRPQAFHLPQSHTDQTCFSAVVVAEEQKGALVTWGQGRGSVWTRKKDRRWIQSTILLSKVSYRQLGPQVSKVIIKVAGTSNGVDNRP